MKLSHQQYDHVCVLTLSGEYNADDVEMFGRAVSERVSSGSKHVLIDCEHLEFVDSAGLESWLRLGERLGAGDGQLRFIRLDDNLATILRITRLDRAFESHPTLESAVRSVR